MGLLRLLLALSVVIGHIEPIPTDLTLIPGNIAVEVFFTISGFYMSLILTGKYHDDHRTFYVNRALRLYPTYLTVVVATWVWFIFAWRFLGKPPANSWLDAYAHMKPGQISALTFSNWTMIGVDIPSLFHFKDGVGFLLFHSPVGPGYPAPADGAIWANQFRTIGPAWSIGIEIWFYALAPFLMRLRSRWIILIAVASLTLRGTMAAAGFTTYFFFPAQLFFFMFGILLQRSYVAARLDLMDRRVGYIALALVVALFAGYRHMPAPVAMALAYAILIASIPLLFSLTRKSKLDLALGNLSYPMYIVHSLIIGIAANVTHHIQTQAPQDMLAFAAIIAVLAASVALYVMVDRPIDTIRQRISANNVRARAPSIQRAM